MRPDSHRSQYHPKCCNTCRFSGVVHGKLLCFHGDAISKDEFEGVNALNGLLFADMSDQQRKANIEVRITDVSDVCDLWER